MGSLTGAPTGTPSQVLAATVIAFTLFIAGCSGDEQTRGDDSTSCVWPMAGANLAQSYATNCDTSVSAETVSELLPAWYYATDAEVTGAPAVDDEAIYFGDWAGMLHSVERAEGSVRWKVQLPTSEFVYSGQITATPALAAVGDVNAAIAASGRTVVAVDRADGSEIWSTQLGDPTDPDHPIEVEAAPVVAGDLVMVPSDVHGRSGFRSGLYALDLETGNIEWIFDPEEGVEAGGCGGIWGTPAVDIERDLVVVGTANCHEGNSWTDMSEAIVGVNLRSGKPEWSFQPHEKDNDRDFDFAGAPNLYDIGDRAVAGLGNKDGWYYVVDRITGELVWSAEAQRTESGKEGFAFGGFIGALALVDGTLVGGTAVGDCPCQHGFDAATGELVWQSMDPTGTYGAAGGVTSTAGSLVFQSGVDQTLRAFDPATGEVLWEQILRSISSSGPSIAGEELFIGTGFREPGSAEGGGGGVQAFRLFAPGTEAPTSQSSTVPPGRPVTELKPAPQQCVDTPCELEFILKTPPEGTNPRIEMNIRTSPFEFTLEASGLGDPQSWLDPEGTAIADGASTYMAFLTPRDDNPAIGSILCTFDDNDTCSGQSITIPADQWTRISIVAAKNTTTAPTIREGFDRLVTTHSLDPPLQPLD